MEQHPFHFPMMVDGWKFECLWGEIERSLLAESDIVTASEAKSLDTVRKCLICCYRPH
jgi:hypothetical protein